MMMAWKLGPALATGCTIVLKSSEKTPLTALMVGVRSNMVAVVVLVLYGGVVVGVGDVSIYYY